MVLFEMQLSVYVSDVFSRKDPQQGAQGPHKIDQVEDTAMSHAGAMYSDLLLHYTVM